MKNNKFVLRGECIESIQYSNMKISSIPVLLIFLSLFYIHLTSKDFLYTPYYNYFPQLHLRTFLYLNPLRILVFWRKIKKIKCWSLTCECKYCSLSMDLWSFLIQVCVIIDCDRSLHLDQYHETVNADLLLLYAIPNITYGIQFL